MITVNSVVIRYFTFLVCSFAVCLLVWLFAVCFWVLGFCGFSVTVGLAVVSGVLGFERLIRRLWFCFCMC